jgi:hypothetical protein
MFMSNLARVAFLLCIASASCQPITVPNGPTPTTASVIRATSQRAIVQPTLNPARLQPKAVVRARVTSTASSNRSDDNPEQPITAAAAGVLWHNVPYAGGFTNKAFQIDCMFLKKVYRVSLTLA